MTFFETDTFQRPANYWLRRAERCKQSGDLIRAAVLERHAVRAEPDSDAARMSYAFTLRQLHCYEASNREAFAALAHNPDHTALFGLIGQNMFNLSMREAGIDAMNLYAANPPAVPPVWQDEAYDMADAYDYPAEHAKRRARLRGLLRIATRRLATGDAEGAMRALRRSVRPPFQSPNAQREMALALCFHHLGEMEKCTEHLEKSLELQPHNMQLMTSAVLLYQLMDRKADAARLLHRASMLARSPQQELLVCAASDEANLPQIALMMLEKSLARKADRFPVCFNLCVCLLKLGRLEDAVQYIHLCREIDPDDVQGEILFQQVMKLEEASPTPAQVRRFAKELGYYGVLSRVGLAASAEPLWPVIHEGPEAMANAMLADERLRSRFLFLLTLPLDWPPMVLAAMLPHMPEEKMIALCREILLQHPAPTTGKQYAAAILKQLGVQPPYAVWTDNRIGFVDPDKAAAASPTFRQRVTAMRIRQAKKLADASLIPWAMTMVHRMNPAQRRDLIADPMRIWPTALAMVYRKKMGLPPLRLNLSRFHSLRAEALKQALHLLHALDRKD